METLSSRLDHLKYLHHGNTNRFMYDPDRAKVSRELALKLRSYCCCRFNCRRGMAFQCRLCVLLSKIKDITGLTLDDEEHLPRHICAICQKQLTLASGFRDRCRRVQRDRFRKTRVMEAESREPPDSKAEYIVPNASSRVPKGKFIQIGKQMSLPKQALVQIRKVNNNEVNPKPNDAENIPPVPRPKAREFLICDQCGHSFKNSTNLKMHKLRHSGLKDFACTSCDQQFVNPYLLKVHIRVRHLGERPFACRFCERKFFTSGARTYHQRTQHIRDGSYRCDLCSNVFNTKSDLNSHKYSHRKPFQCEVCNVSFSRRCNLKHHYASKRHCKIATSVGGAQQGLIIDDDD
ncbi:transcription factor Ouib isoform X2 [Drosophila kikkawai]|uniref:Transcription factor Ouib isoform X2 n=1 Tax=Drosophila kikkawai TaxID=30033 RepID=A0ABM4GLS3_DROKI